MKYANFAAKIVCFLLIGAVLAGYQKTAVAKAEVVAENEAEVAAATEHNNEVEAELRRLEAEAAGEALEEETGPYKDGTYEGTGLGFGGKITVSVTVKDGYMDSIDVVSAESEDAAYLEQAESVLAVMLDAQSAEADAVSGATFSSLGLIDAVDDAVRKAVK